MAGRRYLARTRPILRWRRIRHGRLPPWPSCGVSRGAETVLFINALAKTEGGWSAGLFAGLAAATVGLAVLFYFINLIARKLPLRPLFIVTSAFLFVMAIKFIGEAVQEFQEQAIITVTEVKGSALLTAIGLNPSIGSAVDPGLW